MTKVLIGALSVGALVAAAPSFAASPKAAPLVLSTATVPAASVNKGTNGAINGNKCSNTGNNTNTAGNGQGPKGCPASP